jgi:GH35 family endo-1,4-beta-xylanase
MNTTVARLRFAPWLGRRARLAWVLALAGFALAASGVQGALPAGGVPLLPDSPSGGFFLTTTAGNADAVVATPVSVADAAFTTAWHVETRREISTAWGAELRSRFVGSAAKGDVTLVRFFARTLTAFDEAGAGRVRVVVQQASPDYAKDLQTEVTVGRVWQEFTLPLVFAHDYAKGAAELVFGFGFKPQTVELAGIEVLGYEKRVALADLPKTRFTYAGREPDAAWRRDALARIEQLRKGDFSLRVTDQAGAPVVGATVHIEQRRSAFQWGSALQFKRLVADSPENRLYREKVLELFNAASPENDLKWPVWEGDWGPGFEHEQSLAALRWLNEHRLSVRGHVLVWPGWRDLPKSVTSRRDKPEQKEIPALVLAHMRAITTATKDLISEWDVLNEPYDHHDLMAIFGNDIMTSWFKTAAECVPGVPLFLNDFSNHDATTDSEHFKNFTRNLIFLQKSGAPLGGIGLQGHIGAQPNAPANILATLDLYAEFKLPIRFTEFDINTDDEELQADYTRDFLILAFSHPAVVGVQHWGFWEKAHWRARSAMFRNDWSEKPSAKVYRSLVLDQWRTQAAGATDAAGTYAIRGFHGEYAITVEKDGRKAEGAFVLRPGAKTPEIAIRLP